MCTCSSCARRSHVKNSQCKIYYTVPSLLRVACITPTPQNRTRQHQQHGGKPNWSQPAHNKLSSRISPTERGQGPVALTVGSVLRGTGRLPSACRSASSEALSTSACRSWMSSSSMYWRRRATSPSREASSRRSSSTGFCETHTLGGSYRHAPRGHTHAPRVTHTPCGVTHTPRGSHTRPAGSHTRPEGHTHALRGHTHAPRVTHTPCGVTHTPRGSHTHTPRGSHTRPAGSHTRPEGHTHTRPTSHTHKPCGPHCRAQTDSRGFADVQSTRFSRGLYRYRFRGRRRTTQSSTRKPSTRRSEKTAHSLRQRCRQTSPSLKQQR